MSGGRMHGRGLSSRAAAAAYLLIVLAGGCAQPRPPGNVIIVGTTNSATNLDPRVGTDEASQKIHQLLFNSLVHIDNQLRVVPELAELEEPDPTTYVAHLRHGVFFHNGQELTSADVAYTFRSVLDPTFKGRSDAYRVLSGVEALDDYTVEVKLKNPLGSFPINLGM